MNGISREAEAVLEIKRSKFVGRSFPCVSPDLALAAVRRVRDSHRDADHHCWAYRIGTTGEHARYNDDGEPQGTAGPPILNILERRDVTNALIIVTRHFGGIKLGAGGLARTYGDAAKLVLEASGVHRLRRWTELLAPVPHAQLALLEKTAAGAEAEIVGREFGEIVLVRLRVPAEAADAFRSRHAALVNGKFECRVLGQEFG